MASSNVRDVSDKTFESEVLKESLPVMVHFTASWCGPCRALAPIRDKIADDYQGKFKVYALDIDDAPEATRKYGVRSVPTVIAFHGGQKSGQQVGLASRETLLKLMGF